MPYAGNADRIGNVQLAPPESVGYTLSSFLTSITPADPEDAAYLWRVLQSRRVQAAITEATSGSTGLKNIAVSWLRVLEVPWPPRSGRSAIAEGLRAHEDEIRGAVSARLTLSRLRESLLDRLLSGAVRLPERYDRFLPGVERELAPV